MMQPIMPLLEYNINKEYIVSILCENRNKPELACNGKCYLNKKIKKSQKSEDNHNHSIPQIDLSKYPISLINSEGVDSENIKNLIRKKTFFVPLEHPIKYYSSVFKPPIV